MDEYRQFSYRTKMIYEGGIYHITQRSPGEEMLFLEEGDYLSLLRLLKRCAKDFKLDVFCFCLMPNHMHILLRISEPNLSTAMQSLFTAYAMRFNDKYRRKGHVFCGVYRASPCLDDTHLLAASFYIHLNPQKAGIVDDCRTYRWSSIGSYINPQIKSFLKRDFILGIIDEDPVKAAFLYDEMLREYSKSEYEDIGKNPKAVINFAKANLDKLSQILRQRKIRNDFIISEKNIDDMVTRFKNRDKWRISNLKAKEKMELIDLIDQLKLRSFTLSDISKALGISRQALYRLLASRT